ncbi:putative glutamine dependent NAD+ synthetase [Setomelanomma holmii]|uniref:Glutamine-dependent NAD(+) synthetase n=1 Tax=Setomelanomma holmii TaxID=210430 RepID=A0A9P4GU98_9PLEO|nr:putative glutamine dependent NAD+ synthetase [Setomelanomma holmii]
MGRSIVVATCSLNQWALDWEGNLTRIKQSIRDAKARGASLRVGPELEICGYGCLDHFLESDTYLHCWEMLLDILTDPDCHGILLDIGMPVEHGRSRYNCRIIAFDGKILLIRPKLCVTGEGIRENRYFATWVPFGDAVICSTDVCSASLSYDELLTHTAPEVVASQDEATIYTISAANDHHLGSFKLRVSDLCKVSRDMGGVLLYANQRGCNGDRIYYEGCAMIFVNGGLVAQGTQFSLEDVEVITAEIDLDACRPLQNQACSPKIHPRVRLEHEFCIKYDDYLKSTCNDRIEPSVYHANAEIGMGPACWLWDYLRRSNAVGFLVPLSGGIDSCSTATIVFSMCRIVVDAIGAGNAQVKADMQRIVGVSGSLPKTPHELCQGILHTVYMGVSGISSEETRSRALRLAESIHSYHTDMDIDNVYHAEKDLLRQYLGCAPGFDGGPAENLALQNIQARIRMVTAYYFAQMLPSTRGRPGASTLLVLGSVGVEECLRGNLTKHDCSSADLSPIGSFLKTEIRHFIRWAQTAFELPVLIEFLDATPTAELEPSRFGQCDAKDMGMTHQELSTFAKMRKEMRLGPFSMFQQLLSSWRDDKTADDIAHVVKKFHSFYGINRHKMSTMTPAYHAGKINPDNNRYDRRPLLYPAFYGSWICKRIDKEAERAWRKYA